MANAPTPVAPTEALMQQLAQAERDALAATRFSRAHAVQASLLQQLGRPGDARKVLHRAAAMEAGDVAAAEALGYVAFGIGDHDLARDFYRHVVVALPRDAQGWYNYATALRNTGALNEAEDACDRCLALDRDMAQADLLRSHLRTQSGDRNHVDALRASLERARAQPGIAVLLHYALGKELDDLHDHDRAFHHFAAGAALRRGSLRYAVDDDIAKLERIRAVFSADHLASCPAPTTPVRSVFIVGLPRSGTTMIERVLTGDPASLSNGETDNLLGALMEGTPQAGGDIFERVAAASPPAVRAAYDRRARPEGHNGLVIEKLPMNYLYAGAVRSTMPDARIVHLRRNPMDNLFAMFSTLFGIGYPFSYALTDLADYYIAYQRLAEHWAAAIGAQWSEVGYENFVAAPAEEGDRMAKAIGVSWSAAMVHIERNKAPSATASAAQVRRPIYASAVGRWRAYERQLLPLADRLSAAGIAII